MFSIEINGKPTTIKYGWAALRDFTQKTNINLSDFENGALDNLDVETILALIWSGLKQGARKDGVPFELTLDEVADILDDHPELLSKCIQDFESSISSPSPNKKAVKVPQKQSRKTE